jgi:hypothetical protein
MSKLQYVRVDDKAYRVPEEPPKLDSCYVRAVGPAEQVDLIWNGGYYTSIFGPVERAQRVMNAMVEAHNPKPKDKPVEAQGPQTLIDGVLRQKQSRLPPGRLVEVMDKRDFRRSLPGRVGQWVVSMVGQSITAMEDALDGDRIWYGTFSTFEDAWNRLYEIDKERRDTWIRLYQIDKEEMSKQNTSPESPVERGAREPESTPMLTAEKVKAMGREAKAVDVFSKEVARVEDRLRSIRDAAELFGHKDLVAALVSCLNGLRGARNRASDVLTGRTGDTNND